MTTTHPTEIADLAEAAIRAVPGVSAVYAAAPVAARAVGGLPLPGTTRPALVHVDASSDPVVVTTVIGVDPEYAAPDVADAVGHAVRAVVGAGARVTVRVGRVSP